MIPPVWWNPGLPGGYLSRRWAQVLVFDLPNLSPQEAEASLRFKAQAQLPSANPSLTTRLVRQQGRQLGLVLVDHLPTPRPDTQQLAVGLPLRLPRRWSGDCLLAIETPEGWEVHRYEAHLLRASFPPASASSPLVGRVRAQFAQLPAYWMCLPGGSESSFPALGPDGFEPAPSWPKAEPWGIPLGEARDPKQPWLVPLIALALALGFLAFGLWSQVQTRVERNARWADWVNQQSSKALSSSSSTKSELAPVASEDLEGIFLGLAEAWPAGVTILRFEASGGRVTLTAQAPSALAALSRLSQDHGWKAVRVLQIRPVDGREEFDLEAEWARD